MNVLPRKTGNAKLSVLTCNSCVLTSLHSMWGIKIGRCRCQGRGLWLRGASQSSHLLQQSADRSANYVAFASRVRKMTTSSSIQLIEP